MSSGTPSMPKKGSKLVPVLIIVLLVIVAVGGGLFALAQNGGPIASLAAKVGLPVKTDADVVKDAIVGLMNESSADVALTAHIDGTDGTTPVKMDVTVSAQGFSFQGGSTSAPSQGSLSMTGTMNGSPLEVALDYRSMAPKTYVSLSKLTLPDAPFDASGLLNQWVVIDATDSNAPAMSDILPFNVPSTTKCDADPKKIAAFWASVDGDSIFSVTPGTDISLDEPTHAYVVTLNNEGLTKAINDLGHNVSDCAAENSDALIRNQFKINSLTVYVGANSHVARGLDLTMPIPDSGSGTATGTIALTARFSNFGDAPAVQAPADAKSFEDILTELMMGGMMGGGMPSGATSINPGAGGIPGSDYFPNGNPSGMSPEEIQNMMDQLNQAQGAGNAAQ